MHSFNLFCEKVQSGTFMQGWATYHLVKKKN